MRKRVLLADDHSLLLEAFARLIEPDYAVVGAVTNGRDLLAAAAELKPDVIVLDISMPLLNGLDAARQIKKTMPRVKLVFLTMNEDPDLASEAYRAWVRGVGVWARVRVWVRAVGVRVRVRLRVRGPTVYCP